MILAHRSVRALSQTQLLKASCPFVRHKSITAAIERGRQRSPGRFSDQDRSQSRIRDRRDGRFSERDRRRSDVFDDFRQSGSASSASVRSRSGNARAAFETSSSPQRTERTNERRPFVERSDRDADYARRSKSYSRSGPPQDGRRTLEAKSRSIRDRRSGSGNRFEHARSRRGQDDDRPRKAIRQATDDQNESEPPRHRITEQSSGSSSNRTPRELSSRLHKPGLDSLPFTTAASEFLYGASSVLAAIRAGRRKFYKLYLHGRGSTRDRITPHLREKRLFPLLQEVGDEYLRAMDRAASGRPHNGVILEASPLPVPPVTALGNASVVASTFNVKLDHQSAEELAVNSQKEEYAYRSANWRHPLILYVDGVLDEGNLGAIARSAYFLGVDAVITPSRESAPWSHIAVKASAGAAEALPLFNVRSPAEFLGQSARQGWRIYASDTIPPASKTTVDANRLEQMTENVIYSYTKGSKAVQADHCPVANAPTILMMGAEGSGLRKSLVNLAHYKVGIRQGRDTDEIGVDSLNVSVAASILCHEMLKRPQKPQRSSESGNTLF